jgi:hypothetical protein
LLSVSVHFSVLRAHPSPRRGRSDGSPARQAIQAQFSPSPDIGLYILCCYPEDGHSGLPVLPHIPLANMSPSLPRRILGGFKRLVVIPGILLPRRIKIRVNAAHRVIVAPPTAWQFLLFSRRSNTKRVIHPKFVGRITLAFLSRHRISPITWWVVFRNFITRPSQCSLTLQPAYLRPP